MEIEKRRAVNRPVKVPDHELEQIAMGLKRRQQEQLWEAIEMGFVFERGPVIWPADQGVVALAYRRYCEAARRLYVEVFCGLPKLVRLDMAPTGNDLDEEVLEDILDTLRRFEARHIVAERTPALTVQAALPLSRCKTVAYLLSHDLAHRQIGMRLD